MEMNRQMPKEDRRALAVVLAITYRELECKGSNAADHVHTVVKVAEDAI